MGSASRLLWLWDDTNKVWEKAPAAVKTVRMDDKGQVIAGAHKLCWISCNPSEGLSAWALTDDTAIGGDIVIDHYHTARESHNTNLVPPMQFSDGIWLETFTKMTSMVFGYL